MEEKVNENTHFLWGILNFPVFGGNFNSLYTFYRPKTRVGLVIFYPRVKPGVNKIF
jgi:hypothetical protein